MKLFTRPEFDINVTAEDSFYGEFKVEPLERGFGVTLGNALRRTLISSTPGAAVFAVQFKGSTIPTHEFSAIDGVVENMSLIILNIKQLVLKINIEMFDEDEYAEIKFKSSNKKGEVFAKDFITPTGVEIINKDLKICTINEGEFEITLFAKNGRGYRTFKDNKKESQVATNTIAIDSHYSPILNVSYDVEPTKIGRLLDFERLTMKIRTDGSIYPLNAISMASKILSEHMTLFIDLDKNLSALEIIGAPNDEDDKELDKPIEDIELTPRSLNCLKRARVNTIRDLVTRTEDEIGEIRNLGRKSLKEIKDKVAQLGLTFRHG
ncbi:DNA-directed RNA polymerase subunit alpha [Spiroplasma endosymbiont of Aspidapion aeneum]|uniref:DNA-directed RNA polymerase subunit alpha n=1 Tax=Spiroplasma endosymbiont of Aspidapion aeneum TaxID=3066276 RepID=UPI00313EBE73